MASCLCNVPMLGWSPSEFAKLKRPRRLLALLLKVTPHSEKASAALPSDLRARHTQTGNPWGNGGSLANKAGS